MELTNEIGTTPLLEPRDTENTKHLKKITLILIHFDHPDCHEMIGIELTKELQDALVEFLKRKYDVFAWSQSEVSGIYPEFPNISYSPILIILLFGRIGKSLPLSN